jgi:hypothetical protein
MEVMSYFHTAIFGPRLPFPSESSRRVGFHPFDLLFGTNRHPEGFGEVPEYGYFSNFWNQVRRRPRAS